LVGATRSIVLGKKSGIDSIAIKSRELKIEIAPDQQAAVLAAVKRLGTEKRRLVSDEEFRNIVQQVRSR